MQSLLLQRQDWKNILDQLSGVQNTHKVTIEIIREDFGAQKEVENVAFRGLSYDPKGGTIAIRAGAVEHMIQDPAGVEIAHAGTDVICLGVF